MPLAESRTPYWTEFYIRGHRGCRRIEPTKKCDLLLKAGRLYHLRAIDVADDYLANSITEIPRAIVY